MAPDLIKVTEIFLVPSSFLVAALGTADTNLHRACVSGLGLAVSGLWLYCSREAAGEALSEDPAVVRKSRFRLLVWLPTLFIVGWLLSLFAHLWLTGRPLGTD